MAEPACKDCKFFDQGFRSEGGECRDPSKRIYPRRSAASEVECPWVQDGREYTCRNWTSKDEANTSSQPHAEDRA